MRILIESKSYKYYLAKCHEAFRTGLRALFDVRCFGQGYPGYWPWKLFIRTYTQIVQHMFPDSPPDLLIADSYYPHDASGFKYAGLADLDIPKALVLGDYWDMEANREGFVEFVQKNGLDFILSYFLQPLEIWADTPIADRFIYLPPSFDPRIFHNWLVEKTYDVGFLAAGTTKFSPFYPERFNIHQKLLRRQGIRYLWAPHPGWERHIMTSSLVGKNFSKAINSCRMFITTSGKYHNGHAKYVEILASKTLLLADEPIGWERLRLQDGVNYVKISEDDVLDKIEYYLSKPHLCDEIAERGYATALRYHSCYVRAVEFYDALLEKRFGLSQ